MKMLPKRSHAPDLAMFDYGRTFGGAVLIVPAHTTPDAAHRKKLWFRREFPVSETVSTLELQSALEPQSDQPAPSIARTVPNAAVITSAGHARSG
jgi:hypothetical protein